MFEYVTEPLAWGFEQSGSYALAVLALSLAWFLLVLPVRVWNVRAERAAAEAVAPELERLRVAHTGDAAQLQSETTKLYNERLGDAAVGGCLLGLVELGVLALMWYVVTGLGESDPENGGGPRHVSEKSDLWVSLWVSDEGPVWQGVDLSRNVLAAEGLGPLWLPATLALTFVLWRVLALRTVSAVQPAAGSPGSGALLAAPFVGSVGLFVPAGVLLHMIAGLAVNIGVRLVHRPARAPAAAYAPAPAPAPVAGEKQPAKPRGGRRRSRSQVFHDALKRADQAAAAGDAQRALDLRTEATEAFVTTAGARQLAAAEKHLISQLVLIILERPSAGMRIFEMLRRRAPDLATSRLIVEVLRARVEARVKEPLLPEWAALEDLFLKALGEAELMPVLAAALADVPATRLSSDFSRRVAEHALWSLDTESQYKGLTGGDHLFAGLHAPAPAGAAELGARAEIELLVMLSPRERRLSAADVCCVLGDMAHADAGRRDEALARYRAAADAGSLEARERLAHGLAEDGRARLLAGEPGARRCFDAALELRDDTLWRLMAVLCDVLDPGAAADERHVGELDALAADGLDGSLAALWKAVVLVRLGRPEQASVALRSGAARDGGARGHAHILLATLEGDDDALVAGARDLVRTSGTAWLDEIPLDPWPMVAAVARNDRELLAEMVRLAGEPDRLPEWCRLAGAHALVAEAVSLAQSGAAGRAEAAARMAAACLEAR